MVVLVSGRNFVKENMSYFKDSNNKLFWLDDGEDASQWLPQCTPITDSEAEILRQSINAQWENEQAQLTATKQLALNKLMALGLTEEEALALGK